MQEKFQNYVFQLIETTCGFKPTIRVVEPAQGTVQIFIDGSPNERALIMGREAKNAQAFTRMIHIFARRNGYFAYFYVSPKNYEQKN